MTSKFLISIFIFLITNKCIAQNIIPIRGIDCIVNDSFLDISDTNLVGVWNGKCVNGKIDGNGELRVFKADELVYTLISTFSNGYANGDSEMHFMHSKYDNFKYVGQMLHGKVEGYGELTYHNIKRIKGMFRNNQPFSGATEFIDEKIKYNGFYKNFKYDGKGIFIKEYDDTIETFDGIFKEDYIQKGKFTTYYKKLDVTRIWEGSFINYAPNGFGTYFYDNGDYLKGFSKEGVLEGKVEDYLKNENITIVGNYIRGSFNGAVTINFSNNHKITRQAVDGNIGSISIYDFINNYLDNHKKLIKKNKEEAFVNSLKSTNKIFKRYHDSCIKFWRSDFVIKNLMDSSSICACAAEVIFTNKDISDSSKNRIALAMEFQAKHGPNSKVPNNLLIYPEDLLYSAGVMCAMDPSNTTK